MPSIIAPPTAVDGATLQQVAGVLSIKNAGVGAAQLAAAAVDGATLQGGAGTALSIKAGGVGTTQMASPNRASDHFATRPADVTGSRAKATTYQNVSTSARLVWMIYTSSLGSRNAIGKVENATPPTIAVAYGPDQIGGSNAGNAIFFAVPAGEYYRIEESQASITVYKWTEVNV